MSDKVIFEQSEQQETSQQFQAKQQFSDDAQMEIDREPLEGELLEQGFEQAVAPKSRFWLRALMAIFALFLAACVAQSVQWLIDSWQANQWIYFCFAMVSCGAILLGLGAILREFALLYRLRKRLLLQQKSLDWQAESAVQISTDFSPEQVQSLCLQAAKNMQIDEQDPKIVQWKKQLADSHNASEVGFLFSQNVLQPFDQQAKKLITQNAIESAIVISISPLAVVDMFFIAWRNIRLINQIARLYGMELGYFSRLRLLKLVLMNMALTGATELVQEVGMDWLSQDIAAKLSARAAQGIGAGLLSARLGIKAMEFCRPLAFQKQEKPRLSHIQRELLSSLKSAVLNPMKMKERV